MTKKLNVMLHTEVIECLKPLSDESLARIMRMIFSWNEGVYIEPENDLDKFAWAMILPKLEKNKQDYLNIVERNKENGSKGGRPKKNITQENPVGFSGNPEKHNLNLNYNNSSKEELCIDGIEQQESLEGDSVVSKGLESLENVFPENKRDIGINEINRWNTLLQPQKSNVIKKATLYIRKEKKNEGGKYIKKLSKWFNEEFDKGIQEELLPKKKPESKQTFKYTDGVIFGILQEKLGSTKGIDYIYHILNTSGLTKEEFIMTVKELTAKELLELAKN